MALLVVEDEPLVRLTIVESFEDLGLEVIEASSAEEALAILLKQPNLCGLLTDIELTDRMNGLELAHKVRARHNDLPIVICSGRLLPSIVELPKNAFFRAKPIFHEDVVFIAREVMNLKIKGD